MARREARPSAQREVCLTPRRMHCVNCQQRLWVAYHAQRTLMTFGGVVRLTLVVRRCRNLECELYHLPYRAEEEGAWALPHGEFGLDIITVIGQLRYGEHRSIPEIHLYDFPSSRLLGVLHIMHEQASTHILLVFSLFYHCIFL